MVHLVRQDLSVAGKRAGLAGARSGLFMEQIRIVKEMRQADERAGRTGEFIRPRYMVWENVPGAFSSNGGRDFAAVLEEIIRIAEPEAPDVEVPEKGWNTWGGYHDEVGGRWSVAWRVHDAQHWGVPQRRRRISIVADFGGDTAGEISFERKSVSGHPAPCGAAGEGLAAETQGGASYAVRIRSGCDGGGKGALAPSLQARMGTGGNQVPLTYQMQGFGDYREGNVASSCKQRDFKDGTDLVCAVDCRNFCEGGEINGTLQAKESGWQSLNLQNTVRTGMIVRRLTPMECERLQGFPDHWTDIGEWRDSKGKLRKPSDSPRYKALGNSIALPFWDFLAKRISAQYLRPVTMGSLFDGISGFCLCFARWNGAISCRWASEIEEFPIAVAKKHFGDEKTGEVGDIERILRSDEKENV